MNHMYYKDYIGQVEYDDEAEIFYGEVINTRDVITFEADSVKELKKSFIDSINDYLDFCKSRNEDPDKPFSGKFNLRLEPELHRKVFEESTKLGESINDWVKDAIYYYINVPLPKAELKKIRENNEVKYKKSSELVRFIKIFPDQYKILNKNNAHRKKSIAKECLDIKIKK